MDAGTVSLSFNQRWRTYFRERFPILGHGVPLAVFVLAVLVYARRRDGAPVWPGLAPYLSAYVTVFLVFLQLRILDEFKDFADDLRYRPDRPVPRGLVTLASLGRLAAIAAAVQLSASAALGIAPLVGLLAVWGCAALMRFEFFAPRWLRAHPVLYMASHMLIIPLIVAYVAACGGSGASIHRLGALLAMSYCTFCVFEIGRKIRAPADEREGVETYSSLWGPRRAVAAWLGVMLAAALLAVAAARELGHANVMAMVASAIVALALAASLRFLRNLRPGAGNVFLTLAGIWMVGAYLALAAIVWFASNLP